MAKQESGKETVANQMSTNVNASKKQKADRQQVRLAELHKITRGSNANKKTNGFDTNTSAMLKNQQIAMSRLARSKWRRDPIKERLLFLTGIGASQVQSPEYINYLEGILAEKHNEKESAVIKTLASLEVDREWLWRVKREVDFVDLEKQTLDGERAARAVAAAEQQDRQGMLLSAPKEIDLYTIAARTYGLDANRNVEKVKASHLKTMEDNAKSGEGYLRSTWLLDLNESTVPEMKALVTAHDAREMFVAAESVIQDIPTVADDEEEEAEREAERKKLEKEAE